MKKLIKADYDKYKIKEYWSPLEGSCLLLGLNPDSIENSSPPQKVLIVKELISDAILAGGKFFKIKEANGEKKIYHIGFIYWATDIGHNIPAEFEIVLDPCVDLAVYEREKSRAVKSGNLVSLINDSYVWKQQPDTKLFFEKNLKKKVHTSPAGNYVTINLNDSSCVSFELKLLFEAWLHFYQNGKIVKEAHQKPHVKKWVKEKLIQKDPKAKWTGIADRISIILNLDKHGGATKTPHSD